MNKKLVSLLVLLVVVAGSVFAWREYNRKNASAADLPAAAEVSATELLEAFAVDEAAATARFVGSREQVIKVTGTIRSMEPQGLELTNVVLQTDNDLAGVVCEFANTELPADWRTGAQVAVKGICTGLLIDVVLVRCVAVE